MQQTTATVCSDGFFQGSHTDGTDEVARYRLGEAVVSVSEECFVSSHLSAVQLHIHRDVMTVTPAS